ncbi:type IV secretion system protein [Enterococcus faecalis]|nr:type IV secretion system protein [Enterococcus faecalis]
MRKKVYWSSLFLLLFFLCFALTPSVAHATGWVNETIGQDGAVFNFQKYPLENYSLDFYVDTSWNWLPWKWGEGIGDAVIYGLYAFTNVLWLLNVYISYFIGYIVQEAFDLDFITNLVSSVATNMQHIAGIDENGIRATGLFPMYGKWLVLIAGCYIAYVAGVKRQTTRAIKHGIVFSVIFIVSGVFLMNAKTYLTQVNDAQKDINSEMLVIAKDIIPNSTVDNDSVVAPNKPSEAEQKTKSATNAIRENLFELQVYTPYLLLQYGESNANTIGNNRINDLLSQAQFADKSNREAVVKDEAKKHNNMNMSVQGAFLRFGMTLLVIVCNAIVSYSVAVLTITMITSQILFLLFCAFLPVAMVFSLFPNSNRLLFNAMQKVAQALMTKMGITLILAVVFSLSHSFFFLSKEKGYIWVIFLQIATWLTTVNKVNELLGFMNLGGADTRQGGRFGRMAKNLMFAGVARSMLRRTAFQPSQFSKTVQTKALPKSNRPMKQPISKRVGTKISNLQDIPNNFAEKANAMKDTVKHAPTNAKYKALQMRNNYDDGRIGTEMKNNQQRSNRVAKRQLAQQQRLNALQQVEQRKKDNVRNQLSSTAPRDLVKKHIPTEKSGVKSPVHSNDGKERRQLPVAKTSFNSKQIKPNTELKEPKPLNKTEPKQTAIKQSTKNASMLFNENRSEQAQSDRHSFDSKSKGTTHSPKMTVEKPSKQIVPTNKQSKKTINVVKHNVRKPNNPSGQGGNRK